MSRGLKIKGVRMIFVCRSIYVLVKFPKIHVIVHDVSWAIEVFVYSVLVSVKGACRALQYVEQISNKESTLRTFLSSIRRITIYICQMIHRLSKRTLVPESGIYRVYKYRKVSNIRGTKCQKSNDSRLVLQLSVPNPLKPSAKSIMKM